MKKIVFYLLLFIVLVSFSTDKPAYLVYDKNGNLSDYDKMLLAVNQADIVFFGELHNNPICHWLTLQLAKEMYENKGGRLVIGAEMFEADIQLVLDEYMNGTIKENNFEAESKLWVNYKTDYAPLVNLAKENGLKFIATNLPRRYASLVAKSGLSALDSLSRPAKNFIAPLPIKVDLQLPNYQKMMEMMGGHSGKAMNFVYAQAAKDATMAHFINKNLGRGTSFLHLNGAYHSNNDEGIIWYLKRLNDDLKIVTIASCEQNKIDKLEEENYQLADFIICIPADMTKTH